MLTFKLAYLPLFAVYLFQLSSGLKCHKCRYWDHNNGDPSCISSPNNSTLWDLKSDRDPHGKDHYCVTEIKTMEGHREILRRYISSERNLTGVSEEGPIKGTDNPEKNYIRIFYCKTDGCNINPYVDPPLTPSTIKCFICDEKDANCESKVSEEYLIQADPIPTWAREPYKGYSGHQDSEQVNFDATESIGEFEYKTYCKTTRKNSVLVSRGVSWFKSGDGDKNGKCEKPTDGTEYCYCNDRNGCNNHLYKNAASPINLNFLLSTICLTLIISMKIAN